MSRTNVARVGFGILAALFAASVPRSTARGLLFSPYKDVNVNMDWNTNTISSLLTGSRQPVTQVMPPGNRVLTWAFATGECGSENWGGVPGAQLAAANVQAFVQAGKQYIISTGGAAGAFTCGSDAGFATFMNRYKSAGMLGVDFDIEAKQSPAVIKNLVARVKAARAAFPGMRFSFTLATLGAASRGNQLNAQGSAVLQALRDSGMGWNGLLVNLMVMNYGGASVCTLASNGGCDMGRSAVNAARALNAAWGVPYSSIELTPMIGGNDITREVFKLSDVQVVTQFARASGLAGLHLWSLDRDTDCPPGPASPTCNSYGQAGVLGFTRAFMAS